MPHGINHTNQLLEQHLERTRTHPTNTGRSNITRETRNIRSRSNVGSPSIRSSGNITLETRDIKASDIGRSSSGTFEASNITLGSSDIGSHSFGSGSIDARAKPAGGFFGCGFSGGSVIEHVFDIRNRV
ncbi:unannotated protein [freshwater metagenome]|uniref:Unannotated protein n=1 Tax=freshwater metagenome TaxID=449393 RepID=A0A6J7IRT6_9ZZZZ